MENKYGHDKSRYYGEKSKIITLLIIKSLFTVADAIYTTIRFAFKFFEQVNQNTVILTFDQPFYMDGYSCSISQ